MPRRQLHRGCNGQRHIPLLVRAGQRRIHRHWRSQRLHLVNPLGFGGRHVLGCAHRPDYEIGRHLAQHLVGIGMLWQRNHGSTPAHDPRLLARNRRNRRAQPIHVVKRDVGNDRKQRLGDVGRIQPPAHPYLQHGNLHLPLGKVEKPECRQHLKVARRLRELPLFHHLLGLVQNQEKDPCKVLVRNFRLPHVDAFVRPRKMRRRVESRAYSRFAQDRCQRRRGRSLPVGSCDQHCRKAPLRMPKRSQQCSHLVHRELTSRLPRACIELRRHGIQSFDDRCVGHRKVQYKSRVMLPTSRRPTL